MADYLPRCGPAKSQKEQPHGEAKRESPRPPTEALSRLDGTALGKRCDGGDARACNELGERHFYGRSGVPQSFSFAVTLWKQSCQAGSYQGTDGCDHLKAMNDQELSSWVDERLKARAHDSCVAGLGGACVREATQSRPEGRTDAPWTPEQIALVKRGCELGSANACQTLGGLLTDGTGVKHDPEGATAAYRRSFALIATDCERAESSCFWISFCRSSPTIPSCKDLQYDDLAIARMSMKRYMALQTQCEHGVPAACASLIEVLIYAEPGIDKDVPRGLKLAEAACGRGDPDGCVWVLRWDHDKSERQRAVENARKSCDAGFRLGCYWLGRSDELSDRERGRYLATSCLAGSDLVEMLGCEKASEEFRESPGMAEPVATRAVFEKRIKWLGKNACTDPCEGLADLLARDSAAPSRARAKQLYERAQEAHCAKDKDGGDCQRLKNRLSALRGD